MRTARFLLVLIFCCTRIHAQDSVPAALEKRLIAFTDQLWLSWMKSGDVRAVSALRVQETLDDPPCDFVPFTSQGACQQLSKDERRDHVQTTENIMTLLLYRLLSHEDLDENKLTQFGPDMMFTFLSEPERSLLSQLIGPATTATEFRDSVPRYKELEQMFQAVHVKDFETTQDVYTKNVARLDQAIKEPKVSRVDPTLVQRYGLTAGEYFTVRKGLFIFWLQMNKDQLRFAFVQGVTQ